MEFVMEEVQVSTWCPYSNGREARGEDYAVLLNHFPKFVSVLRVVSLSVSIVSLSVFIVIFLPPFSRLERDVSHMLRLLVCSFRRRLSLGYRGFLGPLTLILGLLLYLGAYWGWAGLHNCCWAFKKKKTHDPRLVVVRLLQARFLYLHKIYN